MTNPLHTLDAHPLIWRANSDNGQHAHTRVATGFSVFDESLKGGLPSKGVVRVRASLGIGELSLFKRVFSSNHHNKLNVFINPPGELQASWFALAGIDADKVYCLNNLADEDSLWATEQCLKESVCHCVVLWVTQITPKHARRLQVAARQNDALCLILQSDTSPRVALPICLDLTLTAADGGLSVHIEKQQNNWSGPPVFQPFRYTPDNTIINSLMAEGKASHNAIAQ